MDNKNQKLINALSRRVDTNVLAIYGLAELHRHIAIAQFGWDSPEFEHYNDLRDAIWGSVLHHLEK